MRRSTRGGRTLVAIRKPLTRARTTNIAHRLWRAGVRQSSGWASSREQHTLVPFYSPCPPPGALKNETQPRRDTTTLFNLDASPIASETRRVYPRIPYPYCSGQAVPVCVCVWQCATIYLSSLCQWHCMIELPVVGTIDRTWSCGLCRGITIGLFGSLCVGP